MVPPSSSPVSGEGAPTSPSLIWTFLSPTQALSVQLFLSLTSWSLSNGSIQPMKIITKAAFKRKQKPSLNTLLLTNQLPASNTLSEEAACISSHYCFDLLISSPLFNHRVTVLLASNVSSSLWSIFRNANQITPLPCFISHCCQGEPEFLSGGHTKCFETWPIITPPAFSLIHYKSSLSILSSGNSDTQITSGSLNLSENTFTLQLLCLVNFYCSFTPSLL